MNRYNIEGVIGEGAYGVVLRCTRKDNGRLVAIKKFKAPLDEGDAQGSVLREFQVLKRVKHRNIMRLLEAFKSRGRLYLVLEYCNGDALDLLKQQPGGSGLDLSTVLHLTNGILQGLAYLHGQGIIHRDIKLENILIGVNGDAKLGDFGFARQTSKDVPMTSYVATRWYRAPELLVGGGYTTAVDVWAVGCVAVELLSGQPLLPGQTETDQLLMIAKMCGGLCRAHALRLLTDIRYAGTRITCLSNSDECEANVYSCVKHFFANVKDASKGGKDREKLNAFTTIITKMLHCDPSKRPSCLECLKLGAEADLWPLDGIRELETTYASPQTPVYQQADGRTQITTTTSLTSTIPSTTASTTSTTNYNVNQNGQRIQKQIQAQSQSQSQSQVQVQQQQQQSQNKSGINQKNTTNNQQIQNQAGQNNDNYQNIQNQGNGNATGSHRSHGNVGNKELSYGNIGPSMVNSPAASHTTDLTTNANANINANMNDKQKQRHKKVAKKTINRKISLLNQQQNQQYMPQTLATSHCGDYYRDSQMPMRGYRTDSKLDQYVLDSGLIGMNSNNSSNVNINIINGSRIGDSPPQVRGGSGMGDTANGGGAHNNGRVTPNAVFPTYLASNNTNVQNFDGRNLRQNGGQHSKDYPRQRTNDIVAQQNTHSTTPRKGQRQERKDDHEAQGKRSSSYGAILSRKRGADFDPALDIAPYTPHKRVRPKGSTDQNMEEQQYLHSMLHSRVSPVPGSKGKMRLPDIAYSGSSRGNRR